MSESTPIDAADDGAPVSGEPAATGAQAGTQQSPVPAGRPGTVARIDVLERDGRVRQSLPVTAWPLSIGRAIDNDLVLDDAHVAPYHAVIEEGPDGAPRLRVLPGRNGMRCGPRMLAAGAPPVPLESLSATAAGAAAAGSGAALGATGPIELSAGQTRLRLRRAGDVLEPELPLADATTDSGSGHASTLVLALLLWMWILAEHAIGLDPGSKASDWLPPLVGAPLALTGWCLMWGLASKIFQHRFEFWPHVAVAVRGLLAVEVANFVLLWLSALSGWPVFARIVTGAAAAIGVATLWAHARLVLPQQRRALAAAAVVAYLAGTGILLALNLQRHERWFGELYAHMLPPPGLMWHTPTPREAFVKRIERLRPALEKSAAESAAEEKARGGEADDE